MDHVTESAFALLTYLCGLFEHPQSFIENGEVLYMNQRGVAGGALLGWALRSAKTAEARQNTKGEKTIASPLPPPHIA